jgi:hypothetical protein
MTHPWWPTLLAVHRTVAPGHHMPQARASRATTRARPVLVHAETTAATQRTPAQGQGAAFGQLRRVLHRAPPCRTVPSCRHSAKPRRARASLGVMIWPSSRD